MERIYDNSELMLIVGGFNISGAIVNSFLSVGKFIYTLGQSLGTSIRRIGSKKVCSCKV